MLQETHDSEQVVARVAALDIGKAELVCCSRVPGPGGRDQRLQEVVTYSTMTRSLQAMADRLAERGVTRLVLETTSDYWKPAFYLLVANRDRDRVHRARRLGPHTGRAGRAARGRTHLGASQRRRVGPALDCGPVGRG